MLAVVRCFLDAADNLLSAQQRLMPHPLSDELCTLTDAYIAARGKLLDAAALAERERVDQP